MKKFLLYLPIILLFISCENSLVGEGDPSVAQDYQLETFDAVNASGKFKLVLIPNDSSYLSVQTHQNLIENMNIYVQNKTLNIEETEEVDSFESYVVYLYFEKQQVNDVSIYKKVYMESSELLNFDELEITAKDESIVKQFGINAKEVKIEAHDKAEIHISGSASSVDLKAKDYATLSLENLEVKVMDVDMDGESEVIANINKELTGRVLENSTLKYLGNPQKDVEVKDNGEILND